MRCPDPLELDALASGMLGEPRRSAAIEHLDRCASCSAVVAELARMRSSGAREPSIAFGETAPARSSPPHSPARSGHATVGRYVLLRQLGSGAMGTVFEALDPELDRRVAIKLLHPDSSGRLEMVRALLVREAQAMARLNHPNVVAVYDVGTSGHQLFIAMELVEGVTLGHFLSQSRSRAEILGAFVQAGRGLAAAHAAGLVHRDFKPANVLVGRDGRVRVSDFGLARNPVAAIAANGGMLQTQAGAIVGTPSYMSPEQWLGHAANARSDQFSFGVALYESLVRSPAFGGDTIDALRARVLSGQRAPMPSDLPRAIRTVLDRALTSRPEGRYETMEALLVDLERAHASRLKKALPYAVLVVGAGALASAVAIAVFDTKGAATTPEAACEEAKTRLDEVWTAEQRGRLVRQNVLPKAIETLDVYADAWRRMRTDVCLANVRHEDSDELSDLRNTCLDRRLTALEKAIAAIDKGDGDALVVASNLPEISDCADRERVRSGIFLPKDPATRKRVEDIHTELEEASTLLDAARLDEAAPLIDHALAAAREVGWEPMLAEAQYRRASLLDRRGDAKNAERAFRDAFMTARSARHDEVTRWAAIKLVSTVGVDLHRPDDASEWIGYARAEVKRASSDERAKATLLEHEAGVDIEAGKIADARTKLAEAVTVRERALGADHPDVGTARSNLALALAQLGELDGALAERKKALAIMEGNYGTDHPKTAEYRINVGHVHHRRKEYADAITSYRAALDVLDRFKGTEHQASIARESIAGVLRDQQKYAEAHPELVKAVALREAALGPDHPSLGKLLGELAESFQETGSSADGLVHLDRSEAILTKAFGADTAELAETYAIRGGLLVSLGRYDEAVASYERAIRAIERSGGPKTRDLGRHWFNLGRAKKKKGDGDGALAAFERSLSLNEATFGDKHPFTERARAMVQETRGSLKK
ncbi:MAG: serine/threonine protein kinase [Polyangiaceae bacterium]|nr:serine/threonine protein kinase [Polyangiaceae bacterium]